jgi:hypothetical protein
MDLISAIAKHKYNRRLALQYEIQCEHINQVIAHLPHDTNFDELSSELIKIKDNLSPMSNNKRLMQRVGRLARNSAPSAYGAKEWCVA